MNTFGLCVFIFESELMYEGWSVLQNGYRSSYNVDSHQTMRNGCYFEFYLIEWFAINPSTSCWSSKCSIFLQYVSFTTEFMLLLYVSEFYI